jgi:hypothetical protein
MLRVLTQADPELFWRASHASFFPPRGGKREAAKQ